MKPQDILLEPQQAVIRLDAGPAVREDAYGARAAMLARLTALGLPVPPGVALSFSCVRGLAEGGPMPLLPLNPAPDQLLALRSSPEMRAWGGVPATLNVGIGERSLPQLAERIGQGAALDLYRGFVQNFAVAVGGLDPEDFETIAREAGSEARDADAVAALIRAMKRIYADRVGAGFPETPEAQIEAALRAMAGAWNAPSARILREAKGAPADAGLGLIVQHLASCASGNACGTGQMQLVDPQSGSPVCTGSFLRGAQTDEPRAAHALTRAGIGANGSAAPTLEDICPAALDALRDCAERAARGIGDQVQLDFAFAGGRVAVLDAVPARRGTRAAMRIAVDLANAGAITRDEALLRVDPRNLIEHLHPQIDPAAPRDVFSTGLGASPGAATGRVVFSAEAAQAAAAQNEDCILVRVETGPEDIRGMHAARGVLTVRGGMTSHAAVIARGIGLPCVVGAGGLRLDAAGGALITADGRVFRAGATITIDGTRGQAIAGAPRMIPPELSGAFSELLRWADAARSLGVRANADTPAEARMARDFGVDGLGLCRTEHMFFEPERITVMRETILADTAREREAVLARLLEMQRADFEQLFEIMRGLPVTIRLLDPPLHEFLPRGPEALQSLAHAMGIPLEQVTARAAELAEVNPMLGMRGVRLGVTMPEIYEMQARAIFEAAISVNGDGRAQVVPEIMIPLVSANREVELVKKRIDAVARRVEGERGVSLAYRLGVMVETPRAALRAGDLAASTAFLSFGTNDLTQMTYGLSRDDAGRFMRTYVNLGVFPEDPFHSLDVEAVGELLLIAARRGRASNPDIVLGLCGEHGGDPASIQFCKLAGFDYVSCSPYRVPIARLAAAQACILAGDGATSGAT